MNKLNIAITLGIFLLISGCVTLQTKVIQKFDFDGNSKFNYSEALYPTADSLRKTYYYFEAYTDKKLYPIEMILPLIFDGRTSAICELIKCTNAEMTVDQKVENAVYTAKLKDYEIAYNLKSGEYFKVTKKEDMANLIDIYTYEIYSVPTPLSVAVSKDKSIEEKLNTEVEQLTASALNSYYPNGVCVSNSNLIKNCLIQSDNNGKIKITINPDVEEFFIKHKISDVTCYDENGNSQGETPQEIDIKRGDVDVELNVDCNTKTKARYLILNYQVSDEFENNTQDYTETLTLLDNSLYLQELKSDYGDRVTGSGAYDIVNFKKGTILGMDVSDYVDVTQKSDFKGIDVGLSYKLSFDGDIINASINGKELTDKFDKNMTSADFIDWTYYPLYIQENSPRTEFELDSRKMVEYAKEKQPIIVVVKKNKIPYLWFGSATWAMAILLVIIALLIVLRFIGFRYPMNDN